MNLPDRTAPRIVVAGWLAATGRGAIGCGDLRNELELAGGRGGTAAGASAGSSGAGHSGAGGRAGAGGVGGAASGGAGTGTGGGGGVGMSGAAGGGGAGKGGAAGGSAGTGCAPEYSPCGSDKWCGAEGACRELFPTGWECQDSRQCRSQNCTMNAGNTGDACQ